MHNTFYQPAGTDTFQATAASAGPWNPAAQHGGPPSALAGRALELHEPDDRQRLARVTVDILRPIPVTKLTLRTRTVRPGKRVALLETIMEADGQEVLHARGWRIALPPGEPALPEEPVPSGEPVLPDEPALPDEPVLPDELALPDGPLPPPIPAEPTAPRFPGGHMDGYMSAIDWRFLAGGGFDDLGPGRAWTRATIPLVAGEETLPVSRTLLVADSGNGVSAVLDTSRFQFMNVDLTVVLARDPVGEWLFLDAATTIGGTGAGLADTTLSDRRGPFGKALQTLLVAPR